MGIRVEVNKGLERREFMEYDIFCGEVKVLKRKSGGGYMQLIILSGEITSL
jgi:hypothetical protein